MRWLQGGHDAGDSIAGGLKYFKAMSTTVADLRLLEYYRVMSEITASNGDSCDGGNELCRRCGLCCDGSLFGRVPLGPEESIAQLQAAGFQIQPDETNRQTFAQPCPQYQNCQCRMYDQRPRKCREFECKVLSRFVNGEIDMEEALRRVETLRAQRGQLVELIKIHLPEFAGRPLREALREVRNLLAVKGEAGKQIQKRHGQLLVQAIAFRTSRKRYFVEPDAGE